MLGSVVVRGCGPGTRRDGRKNTAFANAGVFTFVEPSGERRRRVGPWSHWGMNSVLSIRPNCCGDRKPVLAWVGAEFAEHQRPRPIATLQFVQVQRRPSESTPSATP